MVSQRNIGIGLILAAVIVGAIFFSGGFRFNIHPTTSEGKITCIGGDYDKIRFELYGIFQVPISGNPPGGIAFEEGFGNVDCPGSVDTWGKLWNQMNIQHPGDIAKYKTISSQWETNFCGDLTEWVSTFPEARIKINFLPPPPGKEDCVDFQRLKGNFGGSYIIEFTDGGIGPTCGDNVCEGDENQQNCPADCGFPTVCGDGTCEGDENQVTCPEDCGTGGNGGATCGDGICEIGETVASCPSDCDTGTVPPTPPPAPFDILPIVLVIILILVIAIIVTIMRRR